MIVLCDACGAQNFVSRERLAVPGAPPLCWKCGAVLPAASETGSGTPESKRAARRKIRTGEGGNA